MGERKTGNMKFIMVAAIYAGSIAFYYHPLESFLKDIFVASLYFLVPTGVGLLVFSLFGAHRRLGDLVGGLRLVILSTFVGFSIITMSYAEFNIRGSLATHLKAAYFLFFLLSVAGLYRTREIFAGPQVRLGAERIILISPVLALAYYFQYMHFSAFPLRDIFMEAHFMKGALEMSKYGILNIATGDSYMPLLQVSTGVLNNVFAFDLINGQWILPAYLCVFISLCYYCFLSSFIGDRTTLIAALALSAGLTGTAFSMSNNTFMTALALIFFSLLVSLNKGRNKAAAVGAEIFIFVALSFVFYKFRKAPYYDGTSLFSLLLLLASMVAAACMNAQKILGYAVIILAIFIAPDYHRSAAGFMPLMLLFYGVYFVFFKIEGKGAFAFKELFLRRPAFYSLVISVVGIGLAGGLISLHHSGVLDKQLNLVSMAIVGERISENEGLVAVTAEWLRHAPFAAHFLFALFAVAIFLKRHDDRMVKFLESNLNTMLFASVSFLLVMAVYFSPLPRVHRLVPFPSLLFLSLTVVLLRGYYETHPYAERSRKQVLLVPAALVVYTLVARALYRIPVKEGDISAYVNALSPLPEILIGLMVAALAALVLIRRKAFAFVLVLVVIIAGLMLDKFHVITKLYINPYGNEIPYNGAISHYTPAELRTAERLGSIIASPEALLFSDPHTLGIFEARTGINGFYTFSNLGLMQDTYEQELKSVLRAVFPEETAPPQGVTHDGHGPENGTPTAEMNFQIMSMLADFVYRFPGAVPEARYALQDRLKMPFLVNSLDEKAKWTETFKDKAIWILTEKTVRWAYGEVGYYPMDGRFSRAYLSRYVFPRFDVLINDDDRVLVLRLK